MQVGQMTWLQVTNEDHWVMVVRGRGGPLVAVWGNRRRSFGVGTDGPPTFHMLQGLVFRMTAAER